MDISDRVAVVTGAGVGTGRAIGQRLAARGAVVALTDVDAVQGAETLRRVRADEGRAAFHASGGGTVVNIGSTAGLGDQPYCSAEYGAAEARLMRATSCLAHLRDSHGVRVNCVAPDWVATERAALDDGERAGLAPLIGLDRLCDEVVALIEDDTAAGRVVVLARPEGGDG